MNILAVDDEESVRDSFMMALEDLANVELKTAENGLDAIETIKNWEPKLVFLDLKMPKMNGIETFKAIKQQYPDCAVYIVTAFAKEFFADLHQIQESGLHFELASKPLALEQIESIVRAYIEEEDKQ